MKHHSASLYLTVAMLLAVTTSLHAQTVMRLHFTNGYNIDYQINEIDSITWMSTDNPVKPNSRTITNVVAGTLPNRIPESERSVIEDLTITGNLNGTDIVLLQDMAKTKLRRLDIAGCNIVAGGASYYKFSGGPTPTYYYTANNEIGNDMFYKSTSLETVILPNSVTKLAGSSFHYGSLKSITIGPKVSVIIGGLCPGTTLDEIKLNGNSYFIMDGGILYNKAHTTIYKALPILQGEIVIDNQIATIENSAFENCSHITKVTLPVNLKEVETACFGDCSSLRDIVFNANLTRLGYDCISNCDALRKVDLSSTKVDYIYNSFYGCDNIDTLLLPKTLGTIWGSGFKSSIIRYISCPATTPPTLTHADNAFNYTNSKVVVPTNSVSAYKNADGWKNFKEITDEESESVKPSVGGIAVDLGLSVKWADRNVGAVSSVDYGDYFAWGETEPKGTYVWSTYKWYSGSSTNITKYCTNNSRGTVDGKTILDPVDDAAQANWGGTWRMPTKAEFDELRSKCIWTWTELDGHNGYRITGINDNSIFIPAAGCRFGEGLFYFGEEGYYRTSCIVESLDTSCDIFFSSGFHSWHSCGRDSGLSVRPVTE